MTETRLIAQTVFGGWRAAWEVWKRTVDGWDCDYEHEGLDPTVWPTEAECLRAIGKAENT